MHMDNQDSNQAGSAAMPAVDLGPLSWVVDSLRENLQAASGQLQEFREQVRQASGSHLTTLDTTPLRVTAQGLHDAVGALDLVKRPAAAQLVGAMERAVHTFVPQPELCTEQAVATLNKAGNAVLDYLASVLRGQPDQSVGLFPVYNEVAKLAGLDRIHPADLWHHPWQWLETTPAAGADQAPPVAGEGRFFEGVLKLFQSGGMQGADELALKTQEVWHRSTEREHRVFWQLATGCLQAVAVRALPFDDHVKRLLSRIAVQYDALLQHHGEVSERLAQDLLFFNALAHKNSPGAAMPVNQAIAQRYGLTGTSVSAYDTLLYGQVDPALRQNLRQELSAFKEAWSDIAAGNLRKLPDLPQQTAALAQDLQGLWPSVARFAQSLHTTVHKLQQTGQQPHADLAMEVATSALFLEAALEEHQADSAEFGARADKLAQRIDGVQSGQQLAPLEDWMEALYARVSDKDSLEQAVTESRTAMGEIEQALDDFFRHPQKVEQAQDSAGKLGKIANVLMVLDCDDASRAVTAMRAQVEQLVAAASSQGSIDDPDSQDNVLRLGNSLGALSFMLDMMGYQPDRARQQFHFDEAAQELVHRMTPLAKPHGADSQQTSAPHLPSHEAIDNPPSVFGNSHLPALDSLAEASGAGTLSADDATARLGAVVREAQLADQPALAHQARQALSEVQAAAGDPQAIAHAVASVVPAPVVALPDDGISDAPIEEEDLRDIFLEEAGEVITNARQASDALQHNPGDAAQLTNLRRAFHTLKGSGRMVGLASFGEAAWELERVLNGWVADSKPATPGLLQLSADALDALSQWRESIAAQTRTGWHHHYFKQPAAAMQAEGRYEPIVLPAGDAGAGMAQDPVPAPVDADAAAPLPAPAQPPAPGLLPAMAGDGAAQQASPPEPLPALDEALFADEAAADAANMAEADALALFADEPGVTGLAAETPAVSSVDTMPPLPSVFGEEEIDVLIDVPSYLPDAAPGTTPAAGLQDAQAALEEAGLTEMPSTLQPGIDSGFDAADDGTGTAADAYIRLADEHTESVNVFAQQGPDSRAADAAASSSASDGDDEKLFAEEVDSGIFELEDVPEADLFAEEVDSGILIDDELLASETASPSHAAAEAVPDVPAIASQDSWHDIHAIDAATSPATRAAPPAAAPLPEPAAGPAEVPATAAQQAGQEEPSAVAAAQSLSLPPSVAKMLVNTAPQMAVLRDMADGLPDDEIRRIGGQGIPLALFNAYLNEADAWSRQLVQQVDEWRLNPAQPAPESASHLAHSLAGSSAAVGMGSLASLARGIEHAVDHLANRSAKESEAALLLAAAQDLRQKLHQFAAGIERPLDIVQLYKLGAIVDNVADVVVPPEVLAEGAARMAQAEKKTVESPAPAVAASSPAPAAAQAAPAPAYADPATPQTYHAAASQEAPEPEEPAHDDEAALFAPSGLDAIHLENHVQEPKEFSEHDEGEALFAPSGLDAIYIENRDLEPHEFSEGDGETRFFSDDDVLAGGDGAPAVLEESLDPELFEIFREEAEVLMPQLGAAMRQWEQRPEHEDTRQAIMRLLHTIKGGARLAGAMHFGAMAHDMETAIGELGRVQTAEQLEPLHAMLDDMDQHFSQLLGGGTPAPGVPQPVAQAVAAGPAAPAPSQPQVPAVPHAGSQAASQPPPAQAASAAGNAVALPVATDVSAQQKTVQAQVRVRANVLDRMLAQAGEVMTSRARMEGDVSQLRQAVRDMDGSLERLRTQLRDMEVQAESQMQSRQAQSPGSADNFDPLEFDRFTRVQELTRMMAESVNDVASVQRNMLRTVQSTEDSLIAQSRQTKDLQGDLLRTRMVEFDSLSDRLYRVVRQAAKESDKQVALEIAGGAIEMDRNVIERIAPAFEHLLRNAVVHGIEPAGQRASVGKGPAGRIEISLMQEGNDVAITVRDDGRGLDILRIRDKAVSQGLLQADSHISDQEAAQLIFQSGLSTAEEVTSLAGRGVGMDVVRSDINALGGRIEVSSHQNMGTEFILVLPLTTAVTQVVELRVGEQRFGVPSNLIDTVRRATAKEIQQAYNAQTYVVDNETLPFYWGGAMLLGSRHSEDMAAKRQVVVVVRSAAQRVVLHVDAVVGNHEVVVKNIGPQLARMPGLSGITVLPDGRLLFIYNPVALSLVYGDQIRAFSADRADPAVLGGEASGAVHLPAATDVKPLVLVVDDSITVRRVTERLLKREGYRVALAADGLAALRELAVEQPAIVLSDIEMPQMDGFDLLRNIRDDDKLKSLPVIMITSRTADKHREHAEQLGATGFLGKPYPEEQLLELIRQHVQSAAIA